MSVVPSCSGVVVPVTVWMTVMACLRAHPITGLAAAAALACTTGGPAAPRLADATAFAPTLALDLRYASAHNFVGARIDGYEAARCLLSEPADPALAARHHPNLAKPELFAQGYVAVRSGHSRASTVDVGLVRLGDGVALDLGTPFDFFDPLSHVDAAVPEPARANRTLLREAMQRHGFASYAPEWWHFTLRDEPYPDSYFDVPVR